MAQKKSAQKTTEKKQPTSSEPTDPNLPLFYRKPAIINRDRHANAAVRMSDDLGFARPTNSLPINAVEFMEVVKYYPIVFTQAETPVPVAIVGLERENYFLGADNKWKANHYIPAYVRQYPFLFYQNAEENKFFLCIDEGSPHFSETHEKGTQAFYDDKGEASALSKTALEFCTAFYRHHEITRNFCADLKQHALLKPYASKVKLQSGREINLADFQIIDEEKFNALPEKTFLEFRAKGWLPLIYFMLASLSNWRYLAVVAEERE